MGEQILGVHPVDLTHWRYWRLMDTLAYWARQPTGYRQNPAPTPLHRGSGWIARRSAMCILFDYEAELIEHGLSIGHLEGQDVERFAANVLPQAIRITPEGEAAMMEWAQANDGDPTNGSTATKVLNTLGVPA